MALLRGVNVGRAKRVAMADLRALVEGLGYSAVRTLLNSGNVVFAAPGVAPREAALRIEGALAATLGVSAAVTVLAADELAAAIDENPLVEVASDPSHLLLGVVAGRDDLPRLDPLREQDWSPEALAVGSRVAYLWCPEGVIKSRVFEAVGRTLGGAVTTRNWATMQKLHALMHESG